MMLILSHIHFKNNFPAIYRAQEASFVCVRGTLVPFSLLSDKLFNILAYTTFGFRPLHCYWSDRKQILCIHEKYNSFFFISFLLHYHSQSCLIRRPPSGRNSQNMIRVTFCGPIVQHSHLSRALL